MLILNHYDPGGWTLEQIKPEYIWMALVAQWPKNVLRATSVPSNRHPTYTDTKCSSYFILWTFPLTAPRCHTLGAIYSGQLINLCIYLAYKGKPTRLQGNMQSLWSWQQKVRIESALLELWGSTNYAAQKCQWVQGRVCKSTNGSLRLCASIHYVL